MSAEKHHCKTCRKDMEISYFIEKNKQYKTCSVCREDKRANYKNNPDLRLRQSEYMKYRNMNKWLTSIGREDLTKRNIAGYEKEKHKLNPKKTEEEKISKKKDTRMRYYQNNTDRIREYQKVYNKENRERNNERTRKHSNQNYDCGCGKNVTYGNKKRHSESKRHLNYLLSIGESDTEDSSSEYEYDGVKHIMKYVPAVFQNYVPGCTHNVWRD
jgi:hypothetical protein